MPQHFHDWLNLLSANVRDRLYLDTWIKGLCQDAWEHGRAAGTAKTFEDQLHELRSRDEGHGGWFRNG